MNQIEILISCATPKDLIAGDRGRVKSAISVHSYDQQWLSPYGYSTEFPPEYAEMVIRFKRLKLL